MQQEYLRLGWAGRYFAFTESLGNQYTAAEVHDIIQLSSTGRGGLMASLATLLLDDVGKLLDLALGSEESAELRVSRRTIAAGLVGDTVIGRAGENSR